MKSGLVSVIIPVFNRADLLKDAVLSVLAQTYANVEVIIIDDGSDEPGMEASLNQCLSLGRGKVYILRQPNRGPGAARQNGLEHANGEFVQFLDSDDLLLNRKFELQVSALQTNQFAGVCYGKTRYFDDSGNVIEPWRRTGESISSMFPSMLERRWWGTSTPLYRSSVLKQAGPIADLINEEDWEFDCRIASQGVELAWVDEWVSEQRALAEDRASAGGSVDPKKLRDRAKARQLILKSALKGGVPVSAPEFQSFVSYSFLVARQCATAGLESEAEGLVKKLNEIAPRKTMGLYLKIGRLIGFQHVTKILENLHRVYSRKSGIALS